MSSHRFDRARTPRPKELISSSQSLQSSYITLASTMPRSLMPMPSSPFSRSRQGSSASESEDVHRTRIPASRDFKPPPREAGRPSGLPRPSGIPTPSLTRNLSPSKAKFPQPTPHSQSALHSTRNQLGKPAQSDGPLRNVLRRKAPSIEQYAERTRALSNASETGQFSVDVSADASSLIEDSEGSNSELPGSSLLPQQSRSDAPEDQEIPPSAEQLSVAKPESNMEETSLFQVPEELMGLSMVVNVANLPPPTPNITSTSSPSTTTRYSDSPGPWSSRTSTPTSLSSYSPGIIQPTKISSRLRQPSPTISRNPVARQAAGPNSSMDDSKDSALTPGAPSRAQAQPSIISSVTPRKHEKLSGREKSTVSLSRSPPGRPPTKSRSPNRRDVELDNDPPRPLQSEARAEEQIQHQEAHPRKPETGSRLPTPILTCPPPSRPSRMGTSDLELNPSPVIQSNLTSLKFPGHRRRVSTDSAPPVVSRPPPSPAGPVSASIGSFRSKSVSRASRRHPSPISGTQDRISSRVATPSGIPSGRHRTLTKDPKEVKEPATTGGTKRFGIFPKKPKTVPDVNMADKQIRRGPAAGTGHEGYGKYAQRGRRASVGSYTGRARSASTSASASKSSINSRAESEMDDFLLERLEPIVISGGGMDGAELSRTQSGQSASGVSFTSTTDSRFYPPSPQFGGYSSDSLLSTSERIAQSPEPAISPQRCKIAYPTEGKVLGPTLPSRRGLNVAQPLTAVDSSIPASCRSVGSADTSQSSISHVGLSISANESGQTDRKEKKAKKPDRWGKWNFFQRGHHTARRGSVPETGSVAVTELAATISTLATARSVAHYALLDSDLIESDSLEDILNHIEQSPPTEVEEDSSDVPFGLGLKRQRGHSILLPSPPAALTEFTAERRPSSPKVFFNKDPQVLSSSEPEMKVQKDRQTRLASVGRIPRVVSTREVQHRPAPQSFSRPFSRAEAPSLTIPADCPPNHIHPGRLGVNALTDVDPSTHFRQEFSFIKPPSALVPEIAPASPLTSPTYQEFLTFPPRKGSEVSRSSSSEGRVSLAAVTAVIPPPGSNPTPDEIWNEYDDLLDDVLSPVTARRQDPAPSRQNSFKMATLASRTLQAELNGLSEGAIVSSPKEYPSLRVPLSPVRSSDGSVRLRRSMILSALHSSFTPSTPLSFNEFIASYGEHNKSSLDLSPRGSPVSPYETARQSPVTKRPSIIAFAPSDSNRHRNTLLLDIAERDRDGTIAQINLRSSSLMTSRWLSFGRVLFSPAHNHLQSQDQGRVLVIDGLGNDDWSFYCALTYPTASVYSLSIAPSAAVSNNPAAWQPPPNHRIIHHVSIEDPFPFPKGFFAATIFRFPAACSEAGLRSAVSECKRVLRPGGYLEMTIMDLDMVNMGNRTRKAVRKLKERMCMTDPSVSLKPVSDNIQKLLGRKGFENLSRCMVGVPVAGTVLRSSDTSSSDQSATAVTTPTTAFADTPVSQSTASDIRTRRRPLSDDVFVSLGDLLSDPSPSASNDEAIAKTVARVGRWWYTRCYETSVLPDGNLDYSIWADRRVLRECQKRGTGFRLLIAYAQKPSEMKRRTASV